MPAPFRVRAFLREEGTMKTISFNKDWSYKKLGDSHIFNAPRIPVTVPHDPVIGEKRVPQTLNGTKKAFFPNGVWEYVKTFDAPEAWAEQCVYLEFQGVQNHAMVYVNGNFAGKCAYGYTEFALPIHSYLHFGEKNAIQVLCKTEDDSRWYTGGGIYRDVELLVGPRQHICPNGVKIKTVSASEQKANLTVRVQLAEMKSTRVSCTISKNGKIVAQVQGDIRGEGQFHIAVEKPELWSEQTPELYQYRVWTEEDEKCGNFGIRTMSVSTKTGLRINGEEVKLRGACIHHDSGFLGAATFRDSEFRRVRLLKEAGFNAIRSSHHPASRHLLDACDELGMYVMDEAFDAWQLPKSSGDYALDFDENWRKDIQSMVNKDYNHPAVILYSIGNEISDLATTNGVKLANELAAYVKHLDDSRFTTVAINGILLLMREMEVYGQLTGQIREEKQDVNAEMSSMDDAMLRINNAPTMDTAIQGGCDAVDIAGYNYMHNRYEPDLEKYPDRVIVGSETYAKYIAPMWRHIKQHHNVIGDFVWTGWDYLGETGIGNVSYEPRDYHEGFYAGYPCISANCADLDLTGYRRPQSYYREIVYGLRKAPYIAVHNPAMAGKQEYLSTWGWGDVCASWSYAGYEGTMLTVDVYGVGKVTLLLNDKIVGKGDCGEEHKCSFAVPYEPGILKAVTENGTFCMESAKEDICLSIKGNSNVLKTGNLLYLDLFLTDSKGNVHWGKDRQIKITVSGGKLLGFGSADPLTEESYVDDCHTTYQGHAQAIVMAEREGVFQVTASAQGVQTERMQWEVTK